MARSITRGRSRAAVHRPDPARDRPRLPLLGAIAVVALAAGIFWPRACGIRFADVPDEAPAAGAAASSEAPPAESASVVAATSAGSAPVAPSVAPSVNDAPSLGNVVVGKSTLMHCQDPPAAELKPSKCGEHGLDPLVVPRLEGLASCPAVAGVSGKLALSIDLDFKKQALRVLAGKGSSTVRNGRRDDKAIEPLLQCIRASVKEMLAADAGGHAHARYVLAYPLTITAHAAAPAASATVEKEKAASGVVTVQVDTAIVRDAPSTSGQPIGRLSRGTKISTIGTAANWYHVKFGDNDSQEGWIFRTNVGR